MKTLVVVGCSAGGEQSLQRLRPLLRPGHPPLVVVRHSFPESDRLQIERARRGGLVSQAGWSYLLEETVLVPGLIYQVSALHQADLTRAADHWHTNTEHRR